MARKLKTSAPAGGMPLPGMPPASDAAPALMGKNPELAAMLASDDVEPEKAGKKAKKVEMVKVEALREGFDGAIGRIVVGQVFEIREDQIGSWMKRI